MGLGDFVKGVGDAVTNVAKGAAWVANPTHLDDIAEGAGKAASFVAENPGKTWDTAFEVGRAVVKDQLDPMNLAINAGLIGLTVATGGAAAPAFLAKVGLAGRSAKAGIAAVEGMEAAGTALKVGKGVDTAMDVTKGVKTTAKALDTVGDIGKGVETATDVSRNLTRTQEFATGIKQVGTGIRESKGLAKVENIMNAPREFMGAGREAVGMSRYGKMAELRAGGAEKIMQGAGEQGAGGLRKYAARKVAGGSNPLTPAGAQTGLSRTLSVAGRGKAASEAPGSVAKGVEVAADPQSAVREQVAKEAERRMGEIGRGTGYVDRGMAAESLYQPSATGQAPGGAEMQYQTGETPEGGAERFYGGGDEAPAFVPATPGGKPPSGGTAATALPQPPAESSSEAAEPLKQPKPFKGGWKPSQHFWEGPGREAIGGIRAGHDWRQIGMRKVESPGVRQAGRYSTHKARVGAYEQQQQQQMGGPTSDQYMAAASPFNAAAAAPQATASGASMSDQRPGSSLSTGDRSHLLGNVREAGESPFGAVGPVKEPGDFLDVTSHSPEDYGYGAGGQGQFQFPELGLAWYQPDVPQPVAYRWPEGDWTGHARRLMQIFFAGAESQAHLDTLRGCGVERVAVSVSNLARHTRDYAAWATQQRLAGLDWLIYADSPTVPVAPLLELLAGSSSDPEVVAGPLDWATETWLNDSDVMFLPIWDGHDASSLRHYVEIYDGAVLPDSVVDNQLAVRQARAAMGRMSTLGGLTGRSKGIDKFDVLISSAWWATQKHGETQVWTGNRLVRLNADDKHLKRQRYTEAMEALGVNVSAVLTDDPTETARLSIYSWLALEQFLSTGSSLEVAPAMGPVVTNGGTFNVPILAPAGNGVASGPTPIRHKSASVLPLLEAVSVDFTTTDEAGNTTTEQHTTIASTADSVRQCSTCALGPACPSYQPGAKCSYNIPVVIRTKDQRQAVLRTLVEIQTQRILMGTFAEQVNGQPDNQVGREMDRLFSMVERWKQIEENTSKFQVNVSATGADADGSLGMISRIFGSEAGKNARALDVPVLSDALIEEAEMVDTPQGG